MKNYAVVVLLIGALLSFGFAKKAPSCADAGVKESVISVAFKTLKERLASEDTEGIKFTLSKIRTTALNKNTGAYRCEAELQVNAPEGNRSGSIKYKSELLEDMKGRYFVSAKGISELISYIKPPIPPTREAAQKLDRLANSYGSSILSDLESNSTNAKNPEEYFKAFIQVWRSIYDKAGYSYDRSTIQLAKQLNSDPNLLKGTALLGRGEGKTWFFASLFVNLAKKHNVRLEECCSPNVAAAIMDILTKAGPHPLVQ